MVLHPDVGAWGPLEWALHAFAVVYLAGFFAAWARLRAWQGRLREGGDEERAAFDRAVRRFPLSFYAKMLGQHPLGDPHGPGSK